MFSYLPCGLSEERSYIERKAHIISFFLIYLVLIFFNLIKHTRSTKYIITKNYVKKLFQELSAIRFKI